MNEKDYAELKKIVGEVQTYVEKNKHAFVVPEHLLKVLLNDKKVKDFFKTNKFSLNVVEKDVDAFFKDFDKTTDISKIVPTNAYTQVIQRAIVMANLRAMEPDSLQLFQSLFEDEDSFAKFFLEKVGIKESDVSDYIRKRQEFCNGILNRFAVNLVDMAKEGKIGKIIGRNSETERMIEILNKKKSNNVILCGVEGCGKTSVVEGLALRIAENSVPKSMKGFEVWSLDMGSMIAGTKFRGEFEERLENVIKEISTNPKSILFIDEIHTIIGAGVGGNEGALDASNILKPYLSNGKLRVIGATTYDEYKKILKDKAFARRFKKIDLIEPSKEETFEIIQGVRNDYEVFHGVKYSDEVLRDIVDLSARYLFDKHFPDKAIDVMDEIGAKHRSGFVKSKNVTRKDVENVVCKMANINEISVSKDETEKIKMLDVGIKTELFGQDETVDSIVRKIKMMKAGLYNNNKCLSALLLGATGTGKTEFSKLLAKNLGMNFVKLDMSEYSLEMDVNKLTGCAQGFVGYEQSGALTEPVIRNPNSVVLLDEIEKAHKNVYNLLLQVMDEGKLTDNNGREANFKNVILLMTSNVGISVAEQTSSAVGFVVTEEDKQKEKGKIIENVMKKTFPPEFRNRISEICFFNNLSKSSMENIVYKNISRINKDLKDKNV